MSFARALEDAGLRIHHSLYVATDGRFGHRSIGVPSLLLRTKGRRTGTERVATLIYARDGDDYVLVASNGGHDRAPAWLLNIEAEPRVGVQVGRRRTTGRARVVGAQDAEHERLWRLVNANNHARYEGYQRRTQRPIPVIVVTPQEALP